MHPRMPLLTSRGVAHPQAFSAVSVCPRAERYVETSPSGENNGTRHRVSEMTAERPAPQRTCAAAAEDLAWPQDGRRRDLRLCRVTHGSSRRKELGLSRSKKKRKGLARSLSLPDPGSSPSPENRPTCSGCWRTCNGADTKLCTGY